MTAQTAKAPIHLQNKSMVSSKQAGNRGTVVAKLDTEDPPSKDHRVTLTGKGPRLLLLYKKATSSIPGSWDKVADKHMLRAAAHYCCQRWFSCCVSCCTLFNLSLHVAQEDLLDVLYWLRQLIAILAGVAWGLVPLTGLYAFLGCGL